MNKLFKNNYTLKKILTFHTTEDSKIRTSFNSKFSSLIINNLKLPVDNLIRNRILKDNLNKFFNSNHTLEIYKNTKNVINKKSCGNIIFFEGLKNENITNPHITIILDISSVQFLSIINSINKNITNFLNNFTIEIFVSVKDFDNYQITEEYSGKYKDIKILNYEIYNIIF